MLLTKANVKGRVWTNDAAGSGFWVLARGGGGPGLTEPAPSGVTEAKGAHGLSEQWPEGGDSTVCYV